MKRSMDKVQEKPKIGLTEEIVGITEYLSDRELKFTGILKHRYSDFNVHEIDPNNEIVKLDNLTTIETENGNEEEEEKEEKKEIEEEEEEEESPTKKTQQILTKIFDEKIVQNFIEWVTKNDLGNPTFEFPTTTEKEVRTTVHKSIKQAYPNLTTHTGTSQNVIADLTKESSRSTFERRRGNNNNTRWPKNRPKHLQFVLYKENKTSNEIFGLLARFLRLNEKYFKIAGLKDKRGITTQLCSYQKLDGQRLLDLNRRLRGFKVGNCKYVNTPLSLGSLQGNHFKVILRNVQGDKQKIEESIAHCSKYGFINYFGMQRFGENVNAPTHKIGLAIIQKDWEKAVKLIMSPRGSEKFRVQKAKNIFLNENNYRQCERMLDRNMNVEKNICRSLNRDNDDWRGAIMAIPKYLKALYLHSYQSYIWNTVTSARIKHSHQIIEGDVIKVDGKYQVITEKEIISNKYSLKDVYLPLPGPKKDLVLPKNQFGEMFVDLLKKDSINFDSFNSLQKVFICSGDFRSIIAIPGEIKFSFTNYTDSTISLIETDWQILERKRSNKEENEKQKEQEKEQEKGKEQENEKEEEKNKQEKEQEKEKEKDTEKEKETKKDIEIEKEKGNENENENENEPKQLLALQLEFSLKSSQYATMFIREISKMKTSRHYQVALKSGESNTLKKRRRNY
ncbi:pseudouridylate synthase 7 [Anaeramoeba flamelloides]|uniref:Pseudouridylate synthase 7 n=1 Tax=Anaeramoeba flamelloides TaxID=1746091 RepID=A0ABQ8YMY9_9EUKA|nr:pseudouridylate synthase 7 [Anaeramoeba flamelloides]